MFKLKSTSGNFRLKRTKWFDGQFDLNFNHKIPLSNIEIQSHSKMRLDTFGGVFLAAVVAAVDLLLLA